MLNHKYKAFYTEFWAAYGIVQVVKELRPICTIFLRTYMITHTWIRIVNNKSCCVGRYWFCLTVCK